MYTEEMSVDFSRIWVVDFLQCAELKEYFWVCMSWERFDYVSRQNITRFKTKKGEIQEKEYFFKEESRLYR